MTTRKTPLGELLIREGVLDKQQLKQALDAQAIFGGRLGTNLVELGFVTLDLLADFLSLQHDCPIADTDLFYFVEEHLISHFPRDLCKKYKIFPLFIENSKVLHVAMCDPANLFAIDEISFAIGLAIQPFSVPELRLLYFLERRFGLQRENRFLRLSDNDIDARLEPNNVMNSRGEADPAPESFQAEDPELDGIDINISDDMDDIDESSIELLFLDEHFGQKTASAEDDLFDILVEEPVEPERILVKQIETGIEFLDEPESDETTLIQPVPIFVEPVLQQLNNTKEARRVPEILLDCINTKFCKGIVFKISKNNLVALNACGYDLPQERVSQFSCLIGPQTVVRESIEQRQIKVMNLETDPVVSEIVLFFKESLDGNMCFVPIFVGKRIINLVYIRSGRGMVFDEGALSGLARIASRAAEVYVSIIRVS